MKNWFKLALALTASAFGSGTVLASDWNVIGKVTVVEATYMPGGIAFRISVDAGTCTPEDFLLWQALGTDPASQAVNSQANLAVLLTAKTTGQSVKVYGYNRNSNGVCTVDHIWLN